MKFISIVCILSCVSVAEEKVPLDGVSSAGRFSEFVDGVNGTHFLVPKYDSVIGVSLKLFGHYEQPARNAILPSIPRDGVVFDIGANIGSWTVPLARHVGPSGCVYAFEVLLENALYLNSNIALNGLNNVYPMNVAVGATQRQVEVPELPFTETHENRGGFNLLFIAALMENHKRAGARTRIVRGVTLDDMLSDNTLPCPQFVKMDVEMSELHVLQGALNVLRNCQPALYLEITCKHYSRSIITLLDSLGYVMAWVAAPPIEFNSYHFGRGAEHVPIELFFQAFSNNINLFAVPRFRQSELYNSNGSPKTYFYPVDIARGKFLAEEYNITLCTTDGTQCVLYTQDGTSEGDKHSCISGSFEVPAEDREYWKQVLNN